MIQRITSKLHKNSEVSFEWSLRITPKKAYVRDKVIFWINNSYNTYLKTRETNSFCQLLETLDCPALVLDTHKNVSPYSLHQGIGFSASDDKTYGLYINYLHPDTGQNKYDAFSWSSKEQFKKLSYEFHYLPETPCGIKPKSRVHPALISIHDTLIEDVRLNMMSGFWLRKNGEKIDQISLTYPWQPSLDRFLPILRKFSNTKSTNMCLNTHRFFHLRHIAFNSVHAKDPSLTIYFSGNIIGQMPKDIHELKKLADNNAKQINALIEQCIFEKISLPKNTHNHHLDDFYSTDILPVWKQILGEKMHYHFGLFKNGKPENEDVWDNAPFEKAVSDLKKFIPEKSSVYDLGCGWGGPAKYLISNHKCNVVGITISKTQFKYCNKIAVPIRYGDMENTIPPGYFDILLLLESLEHVRDKYSLLRRLRYFGKKLIIRTSCQDSNANNVVFGDSMLLVSSSQLKKLLEETGWKIKHWKDRRMESLPSFRVWNQRLKNIPKTNDFHFELWRNWCEKNQYNLNIWAKAHPLIEVVAE